MLLFAIPVCDLCKATALYGKETDNTGGGQLECIGNRNCVTARSQNSTRLFLGWLAPFVESVGLLTSMKRETRTKHET